MSECPHANIAKFWLADAPDTLARVCRDCNARLGTEPAPPRQQKPGSGRNQQPRRNEEKRPL